MKKKRITGILFILYLLFLVWTIVFKFHFSLGYRMRSINLIPFWNDGTVHFSVILSEIVFNVLIFIPYGVFTRLSGVKKVWAALLLSFGTSLLFELTQYVLATGITDITDLITNTLGGVLGFIAAQLILRHKTDKTCSL